MIGRKEEGRVWGRNYKEMDADIYCIRECETYREGQLVHDNLSARMAYQMGYELALEKVQRQKE